MHSDRIPATFANQSDQYVFYSSKWHRIVVSAPTFQGKRRIDIRHQAWNKFTKSWQFSSKGVIFAVSDLPALIEALEELRERYEEDSVD